jgi:hypothetical protein
MGGDRWLSWARAAAGVLAALAVSSCSTHPGRLIVVVRTDFDVPTEMGEILVRVARTDGSSAQEVPFRLRATDAPMVDDGTYAMPLTFAVHPREPNADVEILLTGQRPGVGTPIVSRRAIVGFIPGSTRVLELFLAEACALATITCDPEETCIEGRCVPVPYVDPGTLRPITNPDELDAGGDAGLDGGPLEGFDAGMTDAGMTDAGMSDAGMSDAGMSDAGMSDAGNCMMEVPFPLSPVNGAGVDGTRPELAWSPSCALTYDIEVDDSCSTTDFTSCAFASPELSATGLTTTVHQAGDLPVSTAVPIGRRYYWRVRACDAATCTDWSVVHYFDLDRVPSDVDGDGHPEVLVAARDYETLAGAVFVHPGSATGPQAGVRLTAGSVAGDHFGWSIGVAGDLNGDGFGDVAISASTRASPERDEGNVYVFYGGASGLTTGAPTILDNPDDDVGGEFGYSVAGLGDVNGDGYADLGVGARAQDAAARDSGRVFIYFGGASGVAATPSQILDEPSAEASAQFGYSLRGGGDVDGDGYGDVVVGAVAHDAGARDSGAAFFYRGGPSGLSTTPDVVLATGQAESRLGASVAILDLDGDHYADIVVGAPYHDNGTSAEGAAFVWYGGTSAPFARPQLFIDNPVGDSSAWMGDHVAAAGDLNGDGIADLAIGALFANNPENDEGNVYIFFGRTERITELPDLTLDNPEDEATGSFGVQSGGVGDVNGDGFDDLLVGAYQQQIIQNGEGAAYLFYGRTAFAPSAADLRLEDPTHHAGGRYGWAVSGAY